MSGWALDHVFLAAFFAALGWRTGWFCFALLRAAIERLLGIDV